MWHTHIAFWIPKATNTHTEYIIHTNTHTEYIILITFPLQQWLHERASAVCCMYIACLFYYVIVTRVFF